MQTQKYMRKPFYVRAVEVTKDNIDEVAEWCKGEIQFTQEDGRPKDAFIRVDVRRPAHERQTMAFFGDWVLYAGAGFRVYTAKAFAKNFEKPLGKKVYTKEEADAAGIRPPHENKGPVPRPPKPKAD